MKYRAILLFGAPGAGKGTQGKILGQIPNFVHFSCGDAFRNLRVDSQLGRVFMEYASKGQLVPDEVVVAEPVVDGTAVTEAVVCALLLAAVEMVEIEVGTGNWAKSSGRAYCR